MLFLILTIVVFFLVLNFATVCNAGGNLPDIVPKTPGEEEEFLHEKGNAAGVQQRFLKQCFLLDEFEQVSKHSHGKSTRFKNFSLATDQLPELNGRLLAHTDVKPLFELSERDIATLVPYLRLYKIVSTKEGPIDVPIHFSKVVGFDRDMPFRDQVFTGYKGTGGAIKSFSYTLAGTNPIEAEKVITAKLKLWFQSFSDLFYETQTGDGPSAPADLIRYIENDDREGHRKYDYKGFRFKAVAGWAFPDEHTLSGPNAKEKYEALKRNRVTLFLQLADHELSVKQDGTVELDIEYIAIPEATLNRALLNVLWVPDEFDVSAFHTQIKNRKNTQKELSKTIEVIQRIERNLQRSSGRYGSSPIEEQETEILLDFYKAIDPNAFTAAGGRSALRQKLLGKAGTLAEQQALRKQIEESLLNQSQGISRNVLGQYDVFASVLQGTLYDPAGDFSVYYDLPLLNNPIYDTGIVADAEQGRNKLSEFREELEKKKSDIAAQIRAVKQKQRLARYDTFMRWLIENDRIKQVSVPSHQVGTSTLGVVGGTAAAIEDRESYGSVGKLQIRDSSANDLAQVNKDWYEKANTQINDRRKREQGEEPPTGVVGDVQIDQDFTPSDADVKIRFTYFGDLVDAAIAITLSNKTVQAENVADELAFLLGPITLVKQTSKSPDKFERVIYNLAHLPISMEYFLLWYQKNVIINQKEIYPLKNFILDMANDLLRKSLSAGCIDNLRGATANNDVDIKVAYANGGKQYIKPAGGRCSASPKVLPVRPPADKVIDRQYFYLYSLQKDMDRSADRNKDFEEGIYHFELGATRGLLKNIVFAKQDIPFLRETRITGDSSNKDEFLREKYDININMVGNTLFFPGQYIYVNPRIPGASRKQAETLGIGGYHFVHEVFHLIEDKYYQTEIKAIWQSFAGEEDSPSPSKPKVKYEEPLDCTGDTTIGVPGDAVSGEKARLEKALESAGSLKDEEEIRRQTQARESDLVRARAGQAGFVPRSLK